MKIQNISQEYKENLKEGRFLNESRINISTKKERSKVFLGEKYVGM